MTLADRLTDLERRWRSAQLDRPSGIQPTSARHLAELSRWISPLSPDGELATFYRWYGGAGDVDLPAGGAISILAPTSAVHDHLAFYAGSLDTPWPRNLVPVLASTGSSFGAAEIRPGSAKCRIWSFTIEDGIFELFYPSIADLVAAMAAMTPYTRAMAERGDDVLAHHIAAARHPGLFATGQASLNPPRADPYARTACDLIEPMPVGAKAELLSPWPEYWLPGGSPEGRS